MRKEIENIFERMVSEDNSPIIIKTEELYFELKKSFPMLRTVYQEMLPVDIPDDEDREMLASDWIARKKRKIFPVFSQIELCCYRNEVFHYFAKEALNELRAETKAEMVKNANIALKAEIGALDKVVDELESDLMNLIKNTPLIENVEAYRKICSDKRQENIDEVTIKETQLNESLFSAGTAVREFLKIERRLKEDDYLDQNSKWKRGRDKQNPQMLLYQLWRNGFFSTIYLPKPSAKADEVDDFADRFRYLREIAKRWGIENLDQQLKPVSFLDCKNKKNPFIDYDIKPIHK
ncbi:MAG: hypothetical protein RR705_02705 [Lachnospiraceae bacterium]